MTNARAALVKEFACKYVAAYAAGDRVHANHWLIQWAINKPVWFANLEHLLTSAELRHQAAADA
jgi:hypothetical protein